MNKEEFNQLNIVEQMTYINDLLATGLSLTKACENIGIDRATIRKRFKSKEISFNKELNKYVFDVPVEKYGAKTTTKEDKTASLETKIKPLKKVSKDLDRIKLLEEKIKALESQIEATNKRIDTLDTTKTTTTTKGIIRKYEGEEVVRSYRLNEEVQKKFKNYCKANSEHKVSDILSTILEDYLNNH